MIMTVFLAAQGLIAASCADAPSLSDLFNRTDCASTTIAEPLGAKVRLELSFSRKGGSASVVITDSAGVTSVDRFAECRDLSIDPQEYQSLTDIVVCDGQRLSVEATAEGVEIIDTSTQRSVFGVELDQSITMINGFPRPIE
jgi:hypothetical protein